MMEPEHYEDPTTKVMIDFTNEPLKQNERLEDQLEVQRWLTVRSQKMLDATRESIQMPRMYDRLRKENES